MNEMKNHTSHEEDILDWLRDRDGDVVLVTNLAKKFKVGDAAMLTLMNELSAAGKVRKSNAKRMIGFYVPTEAMLALERAAQPTFLHRPPLKIDKSRAELYARLAADRENIRSIG